VTRRVSQSERREITANRVYMSGKGRKDEKDGEIRPGRLLERTRKG